MHPAHVYSLYPLTFTKAIDCFIWDSLGQKYLDFYGGHGVISIGHSHPKFVKAISQCLDKIAFYSNSVQIPEQQQVCDLLGSLCGYPDYQLFLVNSGAEANENALKIAAMHTGRKKIISFTGSFHGRTAMAAAVTDLAAVKSPLTDFANTLVLPFNVEENLADNFDEQIAAVIIEGIQGVGGIQIPSKSFMQKIRSLCDQHGALLIIDEIQSGTGRTGKFFAHAHAEVKADIITMAKGIGNGFPVGAVLIRPEINLAKGSLGTTFGGSYLACAAVGSVLETLKQEDLMTQAHQLGDYLKHELLNLPGVLSLRGEGLFIGIDTKNDSQTVRNKLLFEKNILTGYSEKTKTIRVIPPLTVKVEHINWFLAKIAEVL